MHGDACGHGGPAGKASHRAATLVSARRRAGTVLTHITPLALAVIAAAPAAAGKLTPEDRLEIVRGLSAEYATAKVALPRSKKPLPYDSKGSWDKEKWAGAGREYGPAARVGDQVQITKVEIGGDSITLELNGGFRTGPKWHERIQVGGGMGGGRTVPISQGSQAATGTNIEMRFEGGVPPAEVKEFKKMLAPLLDFDKKSATENYLDNLPAPIQSAIREKRAVEGMDRDQVLMAMGRPRHKQRETKDGLELEDWIYGKPPGKITFVTFQSGKVVRVKDAYAGLGGSTAEPLSPR